MVNQVVWAWVGEDAAGRAAGGGGGKCATICVVTRHYDAEMVPLGPWSLSGGYQTSCEEQAKKLSVVLASETSPWYHGDRNPGAFCDIQVPWWPPSLDPWRDGLTETATTYKEDCCCFFSHEVMSDSCGPMDCSPPGSSVHGIFRARILECVAISFSRGSSQPRDHTWVSSFGRRILYHCVGSPRRQDCCCSVAKSCLTLCDPMDCSMPGFPVLYYLLEFAQTHAHWVGDAIQPSHHLLPPSPPAFNLS